MTSNNVKQLRLFQCFKNVQCINTKIPNQNFLHGLLTRNKDIYTCVERDNPLSTQQSLSFRKKLPSGKLLLVVLRVQENGTFKLISSSLFINAFQVSKNLTSFHNTLFFAIFSKNFQSEQKDTV